MRKTLLLLLVAVVAPAGADAPPIPTYLQRMPDSWEFRWPNGAVMPLYEGEDVEERAPDTERLSSRIRLLPSGEHREQIAPRAREAIGIARAAVDDHRRGALGRKLPRAVRDRVPQAPAAGIGSPRLWRVEFTLRAGDNKREWIPVRIALAGAEELVELIKARDAMGFPSHSTAPVDSGPDALILPVDPATVPDPESAEQAIVEFVSPFVGLLAGNREGLLYPLTRGFVTRRGGLDRALMRKLFFVPLSDLEEASSWQGHRILDADGSVLVDGRAGGALPRATIDAIRKAPARYLLQEAPPRCRVGDDSILLHQLVWDDGRDLVAVGGALSEGSTGRRYVTRITSRPYPRPSATRPNDATLVDWAAGVAAKLDQKQLLERVAQVDGEAEAAPGVRFTNRTTLFTSQLDALEDHLIAYYRRLGLAPRTQAVPYHRRVFRNIWVDFPGESGEWIVLADHTDTAVAHETRDRPIARMEAAPGADDDATATATLMETAAVLRAALAGAGHPPLRHGIRLLHLTGEEFPSDCLGARHYMPEALARGEKIRALLVMDMIGFSGPGGRLTDPVLQLNLGENPASGRIAGAAIAALEALERAGAAPAELEPVIRGRYDELSYLYNTDGIIFSDVGYPVLLVNEHINREHRLEREGYHDRKDVVANLCPPYFAALARMTVAAGLILAGSP